MTGLWTWTLPLWGLGALVFFLAVLFRSPAEILTHVPGTTAVASGGQKGGNYKGKSRIH